MLKDGFKFLVFSNYWISLAASAYAALTVIQFDLEITELFYAFVFLATLCSYCLQRYVQLPERKDSQSERQNWLVGNRYYLGLTLMVAGAGAAILALFIFSWEQLLWMLPIGLISLFYSLKFIGRSGGSDKRSGLRDLPGIKIFMIAISWAFLCGFMPLWLDGFRSVSIVDIGIICAEKAFFIFAITIPFDVRDLKYDDPSKRTIPQVVGIRWSILISVILLFVCFTLSFMTPTYPNTVSWALLVSYIITGWVIFQSQPTSPELFFSGVIDGTIILQFLLLLLFQI